jgi:hypothetical protein
MKEGFSIVIVLVGRGWGYGGWGKWMGWDEGGERGRGASV